LQRKKRQREGKTAQLLRGSKRTGFIEQGAFRNNHIERRGVGKGNRKKKRNGKKRGGKKAREPDAEGIRKTDTVKGNRLGGTRERKRGKKNGQGPRSGKKPHENPSGQRRRPRKKEVGRGRVGRGGQNSWSDKKGDCRKREKKGAEGERGQPRKKKRSNLTKKLLKGAWKKKARKNSEKKSRERQAIHRRMQPAERN